MSNDTLVKFGTICGIGVALMLFQAGKDMFSASQAPPHGSTPAGSPIAAPTATGTVGPREAKLDALIADCQRHGLLGQAVLRDSEVQATIAHARPLCHADDALFGQDGVETDYSTNKALSEVYTAMDTALRRIDQNVRDATPR